MSKELNDQLLSTATAMGYSVEDGKILIALGADHGGRYSAVATIPAHVTDEAFLKLPWVTARTKSVRELRTELAYLCDGLNAGTFTIVQANDAYINIMRREWEILNLLAHAGTATKLAASCDFTSTRIDQMMGKLARKFAAANLKLQG